MESVIAMNVAQEFLLRAQAIPLAGVFVSCVKATVSVIELVIGIAGAILFGVLSCACCCVGADRFFEYGLHVVLGGAGLALSIANILTLGFAGDYLVKNYSLEKVGRLNGY